jgi:hypothetical protein
MSTAPTRLALPPIVTAPETVSVDPLLKDRVAVEGFGLEPTVKVAQAAVLILTVTVEPPIIVTLSPAPGTTPPAHVVVAFQRPPAPVELILRALTCEANDIDIKTATKNLNECNCVVIKPYFRN